MFDWKIKDEIIAANAIILGEKTEEKGRPFKARFLQAGLVKYNFGVCLLKKETIDKFINTFMQCPVIVGHKDNIKMDDVVGHIENIWFSPEDGWFWCSGHVDEETAKKVDNGYNVSCQYRITEYTNNDDNKLHNGNPYDKEILNGIFEHLAVVKNPRYEDAYIAVNAINVNDENISEWITVKGNHIPVYKCQTKEEAIQNFIDNARGYAETGKQSNRSIAATLRGLGNHSELSKALGIKQKDLPEDILFSSEWHHEGKTYKVAQYYYIDAYKEMQKDGDISEETIEKYDLDEREVKGIKDSWEKIKKYQNTDKKENILSPYIEKYKDDEKLQTIFKEALSRKKLDSGTAAWYIKRDINDIKTGEGTIEDLEKDIKFYSTEETEKRRQAKAKNEALEKAGYIFHIEPASSPDIRSNNATRYQDVHKYMDSITNKNKNCNLSASNSFIEQFKDMLYETVAEGIYNRLGE